MRSLRSEAVSLAVVLAIPAFIGLSFPFSAAEFRAQERAADGAAKFALVWLSDTARSRALKAVRTSMGKADDARRLQAPLTVETLPDDGARPMMITGARQSFAGLAELACEPIPYLPSRAAPAPERLPPAATVAPQPAFSRQELMKLD